MLTPFLNSITMDQIVHWGPTIGLSFLGLWLFWKTGPEKKIIGGDQINFPRWQFDSQMAGEIAARLRNLPEWQDKIIAECYTSLFREHTSLQGDNLAKSFLNKWMIVCGPFGDVSAVLPNAKQTVVSFAFRLNRVVFMYFNENWLAHLEIIIHGQKIAVIGRIDLINSHTIQLKDCKLVQ